MVSLDRSRWQVVTERHPTENEWQDLELAWLVCAYTKSNAIVLVKDVQAVGIGAGQQSRVDASAIAAQKAAGPRGGRRVCERRVLSVSGRARGGCPRGRRRSYPTGRFGQRR